MRRITISIPDGVAAELERIQAKLAAKNLSLNVSAICQKALRAELEKK